MEEKNGSTKENFSALTVRNKKRNIVQPGFIEEFIAQTSGIVETKQIQQEIIDEVFLLEMNKISNDPDQLELI